MTREALDAALMAAYRVDDRAEIARLYGAAGDTAEEAGTTDEACFFWVNAYVFALEAGHPSAEEFRAKLQKYGREN